MASKVFKLTFMWIYIQIILNYRKFRKIIYWKNFITYSRHTLFSESIFFQIQLGINWKWNRYDMNSSFLTNIPLDLVSVIILYFFLSNSSKILKGLKLKFSFSLEHGIWSFVVFFIKIFCFCRCFWHFFDVIQTLNQFK